MLKNGNNNKKESWEWRCFYKKEKLKNKTLEKINLDLPEPKYKNYIDQYLIIPKLPHNIKLRKIKNEILKELHIKTLIKNQNNIFKFSQKTIIPFPIVKDDLLKLKSLKILNINNKIKSIDSLKNIINIKNNAYLLTSVKKKLTRYNIKKDISKLRKKIRLEFANIQINNISFKTISLKCTSIEVIIEILQKLDMLELERTNYVNYIKSLENT
ncbi:MAG TPA: hypothetical protein EYG07_05715 [Alphaproteobacteria bacterium]|jgi:hypothetical protein|nr:hypothetical protein [Alphaproteobacteria bacterium]